jgi:hypothetical protein
MERPFPVLELDAGRAEVRAEVAEDAGGGEELARGCGRARPLVSPAAGRSYLKTGETLFSRFKLEAALRRLESIS